MSVANDTESESTESRGKRKGDGDLGAWDRTELEQGDADKVQLLLSGRGNDNRVSGYVLCGTGRAELKRIAGEFHRHARVGIDP